jgi:hypothetical protein
MTKLHLGLAAAAIAIGLGGQAATASPLQGAEGLGRVDSTMTQVQFRPHHPMCRVDIVRRRTPRGVVVSKVRRCR